MNTQFSFSVPGCGTPAFSAFEQLHGDETSVQSDIFSVAATLYYLLSKNLPINSYQRASAIVKGENDPIIDIDKLIACPCRNKSHAIMQSLSMKPTERPASIRAFYRLYEQKHSIPQSKEMPFLKSPGKPLRPAYLVDPIIDEKVVDKKTPKTKFVSFHPKKFIPYIAILAVLCIIIVTIWSLQNSVQRRRIAGGALQKAHLEATSEERTFPARQIDNIPKEASDYLVKPAKDREAFEPLPLDSVQESRWRACYAEPSVLYLRKTLNSVLNGSAVSDYEYKMLKGHASLYGSRFLVMDIDDAIMGGKMMNILFRDYPDTVFYVWVYDFHDGRFEVRDFSNSRSYRDVKMDKLQRYLATYLHNDEYSL